MSEEMLKLGIPTGRLKKATAELFNKTGSHISDSERSYWPTIDDQQIRPTYLRAQEMSRYVEDGALDAGITGCDRIMENNSDAAQVAELTYSKNTSRPARWVDAIEELTETGTSLQANNLRIKDTVITSTTRFIANKQARQDKFKREKIENISILLNAAINTSSRVGLKTNVKKNELESILNVLPAEKSPSISNLANSDYAAVEVVTEDKRERSLVPALKRAGDSGITTYPLNKVIH